MSDELHIGSDNDDLERRIASLESEEWLSALKEYKPVQGVDLYAIGFEAGKQAVLVSHQAVNSTNSGWLPARTALISAVVSVAATALLMLALQRGTLQQVADLGTSEVAIKTDQPMNKLELAPTLSAKIESQPDVQEPAPFINDVLAELPSKWRDRMQGMEVQVAYGNDSNRVADVEPRRLRLAFQRRQLIENLGETIQ
jgi:hypothetical protein